ncbi:MFS transporter [Yoonia sp. SS1-5]|uniref:MFS transporter n=1 Tax=Yoonia rhodophyticola TaxID=3137370 RepID=A0AAN0MKV1_9RHOB
MMPAADDTSPTRWSDLLNRHYAPALIMVCCAVLLHAADGLLVATMLPVIVADIGGLHLMSWVVMLYEVGSIIVRVISGFLLIRFGLRLPMAGAALLFAFGCSLSALAILMPVMLWARLFQGFGGGGLIAMSFVAVTLLFERKLGARAMALVSTTWAGSAFLGPLIGGLFVQFGNWQTAFWTFGAIALGLSLMMLRIAPRNTSKLPQNTHLPVTRLLLLVAGIMAIAFAGEDVQLPKTSALLVAGFCLIALFLWQDSRQSTDRLLPVFDPLPRDRPSAIIVTVAFFAAATIAIGAYAPYFLVTLHGVTPLEAGYVIAIEAVAWAITASLVAGGPEARDVKLITTGLGIVTVGVTGLCMTIGFGPVWMIAFSALLQGVGFGMAWTFIPRLATKGLSDDESALVAGALPTTQRIGYAVGAAFMGLAANVAGLGETPPHIAATAIFATALPLIVVGLIGLHRFLRAV